MNHLIQHQLDTFEKPELVVIEGPGAAIPDSKIRQRVLELYARGDLTLAQISELHQVPKSTIVFWAKQDGQAARPRGRKALAIPPLTVQQALRSLETQTYAQLASKLEVSKARVGHMVTRWRDWIEENSLRIGRGRFQLANTKEPQKRLEPKPHVLSFRLTEAQVDELASAVDDQSVNHRRSIHQLARCLVISALREMAPQ